jgi:hypothetical protein
MLEVLQLHLALEKFSSYIAAVALDLGSSGKKVGSTSETSIRKYIAAVAFDLIWVLPGKKSEAH